MGVLMQSDIECESASELLMRRWFAARRAAGSIQAECEVLLRVKELAADAWRQTHARLKELETLRDALGEQLAALDGLREQPRDVAVVASSL
jgi:hypothetical protein